MIAEPIQGVGGFVTPPDGFFGAMKEVLDAHGILFISDEVQTGWGRTGEHFWGYQAHGITPDLLTFAKGLGNGLSIGGVVAPAEIMEAYPALGISTFGGNPLATAGALANLDVLMEQDLQTNALKVGNRLMQNLIPLSEELDLIEEVRGKGLMIGLELVDAEGAPAPDKASAVLEAAREEGLLIGKGGLYGNSLRIAPPLSLTEEEADEGFARLERALRSV
jgi:4-aminobutyrate aminotransferase